MKQVNLKNTLIKFAAVTTAAVCFVSLSSLPDDCTVFAADDYEHSSGQHSGWTQVGSTLPTSSGNYYLQSGLNFDKDKDSGVHNIGDTDKKTTVNLCLNGQSVTTGKSSYAFYPHATVNIVNCKSNKSLIKCNYSGAYGISNDGELYIENCEVGCGSNYGIYNTKKVSLNNCLINAPGGISLAVPQNEPDSHPSAVIEKSEIRGTSWHAIIVGGGTTVNAKDSTITGNDRGIDCSGTLVLDGTNSITSNGGYAINGGGTVNISGTNTIKSTGSYGIYCNGTVKISGKNTITSTNSYGIYCNGGSIELSGKNEITGSTAGMYIGANKKITITGNLTNDTPISIDTAVKPTDEAPVVLTDSSNTDLNDPDKFVSANSGYIVVKDPMTGQLQLSVKGVEYHPMSVSYNVEPSYTVVIPATVKLSQGKETKSRITVQDVSLQKGQQVNVSLTGASPTPDGTTFHVQSNNDNTIDYTIKRNNQPVRISDNLLRVTCEDGSGTAELTFSAPSDITYAGRYTGVLTFTISVS